jgi:hypothetical protein
VDITANGADIQIGSTIVLWLLPDNQMQLIVVSGAAEVGGLTVPAGFTLFAPLNDEGDVENPGDWTGFRALTEEELKLLLPLELIPERLLHYRIIIPTRADIQRFLALLNSSNVRGGAILSGPAAGDVDCRTLIPTSPLGGMDYGHNTFYWDAAAGATSYQVNVYDENGVLVATGSVNAPTTTLALDVLSGSGIFYSWEVSAFLNGQLACTTARVSMERSGAPNAPPTVPTSQAPAPPVCGNRMCEPPTENPRTCPRDC